MIIIIIVIDLRLLAPLFVWFPCIILLGSFHYQFAYFDTSAYRVRIHLHNTGLSHTTIPAQQLYQPNLFGLNLWYKILTVTIFLNIIKSNAIRALFHNPVVSHKHSLPPMTSMSMKMLFPEKNQIYTWNIMLNQIQVIAWLMDRIFRIFRMGRLT